MPRSRTAAATMLFTLSACLASGAAPVAAESTAGSLKAVVIVGPTNGLTDSNLAHGERFAQQAAAAGMDVRRVFFPNATWENVLANVQGASLVVYFGHGYGWPSPYTSRLTETRQDGFGLNSFAGSGRTQYTYYGAAPIRNNIELAANAVVILVHGCYTAGNAEPGMAIPSESLARQRVDNYASGFLAAGAAAVFAFGWDQRLDYAHALATTDATMDELFMTPAGGSPAGFVGWRDRRLASERTPDAEIHLDPHPSYGYYRALTGSLGLTTAEWRAGAGGGSLPAHASDPPDVILLSAHVDDAAPAGNDVARFHPNGDGLADRLRLEHTVSRAARLEVSVTNATGVRVRSYSTWSPGGTGSSHWDGRDDAGRVVPDGHYVLTYVARDGEGTSGTPASVAALVLTALALRPPTRLALHASDADGLARSTTLPIVLNQPARVQWQIKDDAGRVVRSVRVDAPMSAGSHSFTWDGRDDAGRWVVDGRYRSVVRAQTGLGAYAHERSVHVGAFRLSPSVVTAVRGATVVLEIVSTEELAGPPSVRVTQPGVPSWSVAAEQLSSRRYRAAIMLKADGESGAVEFVVSGTDVDGGGQTSAISLPLD